MSDVYDLDAILAEFTQYSEEVQAPAEKAYPPAKPVYAPPKAVTRPVRTPVYEEPGSPAPAETPETETPAPVPPAPKPERKKPAPPPAPVKKRPPAEDDPDDYDDDGDEDEWEDEDDDAPEEVKPRKLRIGALRTVLGIAFAVVTVLCLVWLAKNVHPDIGVSEVMRTQSKMDLVSRLDVFANNAKGDALGELAYIRKIYTIDPSASCAPKPDESRYSTYSIDEADRVMTEVVERARQSGLLDGQDVIFSPDADFYWDSDIRCYCDDTIMVICWKESIERRVCSCVEVKIADASQFRRKLTEDYFGSSVLQYATQMANSVNAVTAMNADFYAFRPYGIVVYQGEIFRYGTTIDTLFVDNKGDFSFVHRYDDPGQEAMQQRVYENHVNFSLVFGPVLIEDGVVQHLEDNYGGLGEMNMEYSRAGIGQYDTLHYLYMTVNHSNDGTPRATVNEFANIIATKNLKQAYNLDGGQTSEEVFHGEPFNHVDYGEERLISDIIYFGTAIPESEVSG